MSTVSKVVSQEKEEMVDDVSEEKLEVSEEELDSSKLAKLKAKMKNKEETKEDMPAKIVMKKTRSINIGIIGSGQCGSNLASEFFKLGYSSVAINTAHQDLEHIKLPSQNKLFLDFGLGGTAKSLEMGGQATNHYRDEINQLIHEKLSDAQLFLLCISLGGGSGAGSAEVVVDILTKLEKPVVVLAALPMNTDDPQTKSNALITLSKLTKMVQTRKIDNLIICDNARIENIYSDVNQLNFFNVANQAIVEPIDIFNSLSSASSSFKPLDPTEFGKLFTDGRGLTVYGTMKVYNYQEETAMAEAVIDNLSNSLLASNFDLKKARYVGVMLVANEKVWSKIASANINYALAVINEVCKNPLGVFKGIYTVDSDDDCVKVYSMFSGLVLPEERINQLKAETKDKMAAVEAKDEERNLSLKLDVQEETVSAAEAIKKRIEAKKSAFGKLTNNAVLDRRKK